ncbi:MAG TPA: DUF2946 family protein [Gallionella sp.]|nr:DUF2946 family protein [Gallionella sp.]
MTRPSKRFVAVLLAIWLPLFSGNVLAAAITMQSMGGDCHVAQSDVMQPAAQHTHHNMDQQMQQHDHRNDQPQTSHKDCGVCQLAGSGYLAAVIIEVAEMQMSALSFTPAPAQFQSHTSAPLDPPPLARA